MASFEEKLENNLRVLIDQLAPRLAEAQQELVLAGTYAKGSPFRQLRPFEFEDADIFFGRTKAIDEVLTAMRDQTAAGSGFTLLFGSSGSGKSSLARGGVLPMLVRPGVIEGVGLWRWTIMLPSEAVGDIFDGLAAALLATTALPEIRTNGGATLTDLAKALREAPGGVSLLIKSSLAQAARDVQAKELLAEPPAARLVIVIDQFEEMFTLSARFSPDISAPGGGSGRAWQHPRAAKFDRRVLRTPPFGHWERCGKSARPASGTRSVVFTLATPDKNAHREP